MLEKINVGGIVGAHLRTIVVSYSTKKRRVADCFLFFGVPVLLAAGLGLAGVQLTDRAVELLMAVMSILAGLLFNLLVLIYDLAEKAEQSKSPSSSKVELLHQTFANISFSMLLSVVIVAVLVARVLVTSDWTSQTVVLGFTDSIVFVLVGHFVLTLLMVLKRVHVLLGVNARGDY